ncbi:hypothetical protein [Streptomyces sp. NPDC002851]
MTEHDLPAGVDRAAVLALSEGHHARAVRPLGPREIAGHLVKTYALEAPGRTITAPDVDTAIRVAEPQLGIQQGSLGLGVLIVHAGGDGDYVLVHSWIEGDMSSLGIFTGPRGRLDELRPGRVGLSPCVWEAAILAHERDAFTRHVLDGTEPLDRRVAAWTADVLKGEVR